MDRQLNSHPHLLPGRYLRIDFSGNSRMWSPGCSNGNVWIAEVECGATLPTLVNLRSVQQLDSNHSPFNRLMEYLRQSEFAAAAGLILPGKGPVGSLLISLHIQEARYAPGIERGQPEVFRRYTGATSRTKTSLSYGSGFELTGITES
jgi:hypothetical protein